MTNLIPIKRALLSVSDKTGIVELAKKLESIGCEIISTGGTMRQLNAAGIQTTEISQVTGNPEAFGGRMKTISFQIGSALLFDRERDANEAESLAIEAIDLVVCNLYPFQKVLEQGAAFETLVENIDIGGPTMVRAAAKNFKYVGVLTAPSDYERLIGELDANEGALTYEFRKYLMTKAFNHTADYDALIATTMDETIGTHSLRMAFGQGWGLRYGENSHQSAKIYRDKQTENSLFDIEILHGKQLSFNNYLDINAAVEAIIGQEKTACSVVKHNNPCGFAVGEEQAAVLEAAWNGDAISAFGSIIAFNKTVSLETVQFFNLDHPKRSQRKFIEVVIAPDYDTAAFEYLSQHKNLRILKFNPNQLQPTFDYRYINGALLVQEVDNKLYDKLENKTENILDVEAKEPLIAFGIHIMRQIKSNSITVVRQTKDGIFQLLGMGAGQPNRLISTKLAVEKCRENLQREYEGDDFDAYYKEQMATCILVSDAFFPFEDNIEIAAEAGIKAIIQPGGSIRDKHVVAMCDKLGVAMAFSGLRHCKH